MFSQTVINWFSIIYTICGMLGAVYLVKARALHEEIRKENHLEKTNVDRFINLLTIFMVASVIILTLEFIRLFFRMF